MDDETITRNFTYQQPTPDEVEVMTSLRILAKALALRINADVPEGREKALAITNLEQSIMWANAGIVRAPLAARGEPTEPLFADIDALPRSEPHGR